MTAPMQSGSGSAVAGAALAATGAAASIAHVLWLAAVLFLIGGTLVALSKLAPRIALEPVRTADGRYRPRFTVNGRAPGGARTRRSGRR